MPTILIVEDEAKLRDVLRGYFERDGMTVLTAATGAEGLSLVTHAKPDLVVLDLGLPDIPWGVGRARNPKAFTASCSDVDGEGR